MFLKKYLKLIIAVLITAGMYHFLSTESFINIYRLVEGRGYYVPTESTIAEFRVDKMNYGSGEWWVIGQDPNYHFLSGIDNGKYAAFPKNKKVVCHGFEPNDIDTWCANFLILHQQWSKKWHW